jgi:Na+-transporting methylmalonyl-CoA/oxaloacetate decarboxylase gamma subunit
MSRRSRYPRYSYDEYHHYQRRHYGCWYRLKRFVFGVVAAIASLLAGALILGLIILAFTYRAYLGTVLFVLLGIGGVLVVLVLLKVIVNLITAIVNVISAMRIRAIQASKAKVELSRRKLERDTYQQRLRHQERQQPVPAVSSPSSLPHEQIVRRLPMEQSPGRSEIPVMPQRTTVHYQQIQHRVKPGQLVALVRANGSLRLESWDAFKILLVLGGSASGKTSTIAGLTLGFVAGGGFIVPCDPHETKEDSLFNKIAPLAGALYPGATFASDHQAILENIRLVNAILEDRIENPANREPVLLIVEELNRLLRDKAIAKEVRLILETLGEEGRGYNVFVLVGCQRVTGLADIRKAFISYIVHRCDETEAQHVIPQRYAKHCSELRPGQCFVKDWNGTTEGGLQVLVSRQDVEQASLRLSEQQNRWSWRYPTMKLDQAQPRQNTPLRPMNPNRDPQTMPRPLHRTCLQAIQHEQPLSNPLHTWNPPQPAKEGESVEDISHLFNAPGKASPHAKDTEELSPSDLTISQQFEILAAFRNKKKSDQEKEH